MASVQMNSRRGFQMFLTNSLSKPNIYLVKTMAYKPLNVNDGNDKKPRSHVRSHDNRLNNKLIFDKCERVNSFSCAHVGNYFISSIFSILSIVSTVFIFFVLSRAYILLFTCSHLIKINIKTMAYHVNELRNSFPCHSHRSHLG